MKTKSLILVVAAFLLLQLVALAAPAPVTVTDITEQGMLFDDVCYSFADGTFVIDIGERQNDANVRYAEINGRETLISENNNQFAVEADGKNVLVEITEKVSPEAVEIVESQYFYVNAGDSSVKRLDVMDTYMQMYDEKGVRLREPMGFRFKSRITTASKNENTAFTVDEYGYIVAVASNVGEEGLTLDSPKYVKGVGFDRKNGLDIVFDSSNSAYDVFTGVLKNIPISKYKTDITGRTYTVVTVGDDSFTLYGEPLTGNVYDVSRGIFAEDDTNCDVAKIVFDYVHYMSPVNPSFTDTSVSKSSEFKVRGKFTNTDSVGKQYHVYLASYDNYGNVVSVDKSATFTIKEGSNTFNHQFSGDYSSVKTKLFVFTSDMEFICQEKSELDFFINWEPEDADFYNELGSSKYGYGTTFEDNFEDDDEVTVAEAIAIASHLHAKYNGYELEEKPASEYVLTYEMDDASDFIDLDDRNSVNLTGINLSNAEGGIDEENGYLYGTSSVKTASGIYDPQVIFNGLSLDARNYNKVKIRMKFERVSGGTYSFTNQTFQIFYKTSVDSTFNETKSKRIQVGVVTSSPTSWFTIELDMSSDANWKEIITSVRLDPLNAKGKFYIDSVTFAKSDESTEVEWFDKYLDYVYNFGILPLGKFERSELDSSITKKDFIDMLVKIYPEEYFSSINSISGIPDVDKNMKNSEVYYMLYSSGITLGFDEEGNLGLDETITRSGISGLINRILVPSNRLVGSVDSDWDEQGSEHDFEFNNPSDKDLFKFTRAEILSNDGGKLKIKTTYDAYMIYNKACSIDADRYTKLRIRVKAEYESAPTQNNIEFFFLPEGVSSYSGNYCVTTSVADYYLDELGWYIFEIDLSLHPQWEGTITGIRFDTINDAGIYTYDYIRFIENPYYNIPDGHDELVAAGYSARQLMPDGFENGFVVSRVDQSVKWPNIHGLFTDYCSTVNPDYDPDTDKPLWTIGPWWQGTGEGFTEIDLIENKDTTKGIYTLADTYGVNTITYDPEEKSITQRLNATKIYNGKPHDIDTYNWWPHQLLDTNDNFTSTVNKETHSADGDRMFVELDIRMLDFKNTTNPEGRNVCSYLAYFYLRRKDNPSDKIWFGLNLFSTSATTSDPIGLSASKSVTPNWSPDSAAHQFMYGMPMAVVYEGIENSFNPSNGVADVSDEWKHIRLDITPHIDRAVEWANRDNIFGCEVTKEDMFFNGVNIGYEIHGNYDCTFEIKNLKMISYNLD